MLQNADQEVEMSNYRVVRWGMLMRWSHRDSLEAGKGPLEMVC